MTHESGAVVLVTGAGGGIGGSIAQAFALLGESVHVVGRQAAPLERLVDVITRQGGQAHAHVVDVTNDAEVKDMIASLDRLDVAVNAAGAFAAGPLDEMPPDDFERMFTVNVMGTWTCMRHEMARMKLGGGGRIINIGSNIGARMVRPTLGAYAASKAAVSSLGRTAALEGIAYGVRVNTICPGPVDTAMSMRPGEDEQARDERIAATNPSGRVATREEIAATALWLASPSASYVVGQDIVIDGGASI